MQIIAIDTAKQAGRQSESTTNGFWDTTHLRHNLILINLSVTHKKMNITCISVH